MRHLKVKNVKCDGHRPSTMLLNPLLLVDCVVILLAAQWFKRLRARQSEPLPPGPPGRPLIGNTLDMLSPEIWETARKWGEIFGGIIYLKSFGKAVIVINSYNIAVDLLEGKPLNYSDRPQSVMVKDLQRWDWLFSALSYGAEWRKKRAPVQRFFETPNLVRFEDTRKAEMQKFLRVLLRDPENYDTHTQACIASLIIRIVYGHEVTSPDDPYATLSKKGFEYVAMAFRPGAFLVEIIPWLKYVPKWFPGAGFQSIAEAGAKASHDMQYLPYYDARDKYISGTAVESFTSQLIEEYSGVDGGVSISDEETISAASGVFYVGGVDTTVTSLMSFFLAMTLYPEVQKQCQEEIDRVVGVDHLPGFVDHKQLPYCSAMCKEILRWKPTAVLGLAHATREDDIYAGYRIPAKATIVTNVWAMLMDPKEYPEPEVFRPERFLPGLKRVERDPAKIAFGFGRRICPANKFAENNLLFITTHILAVFKISKVVGKDGKVIEPTPSFTSDGIVRHTGRFECEIKPRSENTVALVAMD
ncbi:cytochrome P450 [Schizopora paradoxa]|uniref:Cytochrome P450 n=1 Tax=Schizopora paradoxa TaxID=27342 RepID=A0A0H2RD00_9AGAM|nr:cytochrome P450 [Schizopora paradoxa]